MPDKKKFISSQTQPAVSTKFGILKGLFFDGVYCFLGIQYGKAKRFEMPENPNAWDGIKNATAYGAVCPLIDQPIPTDEILVPHRFWPADENCLNLNLWTTSLNKHAKKPVMVWMHGGGFSAGSAVEHIAYDGNNMAKQQDVVMVCVNHRLNAFGHMDVSEYGEKFWNSTNVGIADLVQALKWVRENITCFGGDPENVTIFGQSGGGGKVTTLCQTPAADGLFHKAIVMSGINAGDFGDGFNTVDRKQFTEELMKELCIDHNIAELQNVSFDVFTIAVRRTTERFMQKGQFVDWSPVANGWYLGYPMKNGFCKHYQNIPMIIGTCYSEFSCATTDINKSDMTEDEQQAYLAEKYGKENSNHLIEVFREVYPDSKIIYAAAADYSLRQAAIDYAHKKAETGQAPNYLFLFNSEFDVDNGRKPWHCCDIPFFFANAETIPYCWSTPNMMELQKIMSCTIANFARTGNPNGENIPKWSPVTEKSTPTLIFGEHIALKTDHDTKLLALLKEITPVTPFDVVPNNTESIDTHSWIY